MESSACRRRASDVEQSSWSYSMTAESGPVKEEPEWGVCGVSEAAAAEGLYADHKVKDELVFGPEVVQQQDIAFSMQNAPSGTKERFCKPKPEGGTKTAPHACPGDKPRCKTGVRHITPKLFSCSSCKKQFITEAFLHKHMQTHKDVKLLEPTGDDVPKSKPNSYGDGTLGKRSTDQRGPRGFFDGLKQLPVEHNVLSSAEQGACKLEPADEAAAESTRTQSTATTCKHMHTGQKPHSCDTCREQLTQRGHLTTHTQTGTVEKPYSCDICNKRFICKTDLNSHIRIHTVDGAEQTVVKQECSDDTNDSLEDSCASSECSGEYLKEEPAVTDCCNEELLMLMLRPCSVRLDRTLVDKYTTSTLRAPPDHRSQNKARESFSNNKMVKNVVKNRAKEEHCKCNVCTEQFSRKFHLILHKKTHVTATTGSSYVSGTCSTECKDKLQSDIHKRIDTGQKPYCCDVCQKRFSQQSTLNCHKRVHTGQKPYCCDVCQKRFADSSHFAVHKRIHTGQKPYCCDVCQKRFRRREHLNSHKRIHTGEKPYSCDVCQKQFSRCSHLNSHKRVHTGQKPHCCDVCQKRFSEKANLNIHKRVHTGQKPYGCDVCHKRFSSLSGLTTHNRIHTGEKPYGCDVCPKRFSQKSNLTDHERIHTGEKPYGCDVCQKRFSQKSNLIDHERIHTGQKPYGCDVCPKRFASSSRLTVHSRVHTGQKPHCCDLCQKRFSQKSNLTDRECVGNDLHIKIVL